MAYDFLLTQYDQWMGGREALLSWTLSDLHVCALELCRILLEEKTATQPSPCRLPFHEIAGARFAKPQASAALNDDR